MNGASEARGKAMRRSRPSNRAALGALVLSVLAGLAVSGAGCRRSSERISPEREAGAAESPLDDALKLGPIDLAGDEAQSFWEEIEAATEKQDRWVEATLVRRVPGGYVARLQGLFAPGRRLEHGATAWLPSPSVLDPFLGSRIMCKVRSADARRGAVVLSGDVTHERARRETLSRLVPGAKLRGRVTVAGEIGATIALDDVPDELWLATVMVHATAFGPNGAPEPGAKMVVTPDQAWTPAFDSSLFFVTPM